jgi:hypothetical protein
MFKASTQRSLAPDSPNSPITALGSSVRIRSFNHAGSSMRFHIAAESVDIGQAEA